MTLDREIIQMDLFDSRRRFHLDEAPGGTMLLRTENSFENIDANDHALVLERPFENGGHVRILKQLRGQRDCRLPRTPGGGDPHAPRGARPGGDAPRGRRRPRPPADAGGAPPARLRGTAAGPGSRFPSPSRRWLVSKD